MRQVTHALLTRPPLSHFNFHPKTSVIVLRSTCMCVKHAASVHPEPGSNSHVQSLWSRTWLAFSLSCSFPYSLFKVLFSEFLPDEMTFHLIFRNLSGLHCCLVFKVPLSLSAATRSYYHKSFALSTIFLNYF